MSILQRACKTLGGMVVVLALPLAVLGQTNSSVSSSSYGPQAGEYSPAGILLGEQNHPALALNSSGGFLVWQDNITDGDGLGISAVRLDSTLSPTLGNFRVNQQGAGDQENPQVALLKNGGAVFVWQSGPLSFQHIVARFLGSNGLWLTGDITVNTATNYQANPAIALLTNGNVIVTWGSYGQDNADGFQGVYGQILSPTGQKVGSEFRINQFTPYNQRTPAVATLPNGNFMVAWVSELQRTSQGSDNTGTVQPVATGDPQHPFRSAIGINSVDIYARMFSSSGVAVTGEFLVNVLTNVCANPAIGTASDGSFLIAWSQKDSLNVNNSWDVWGRQFNKNGVGGTPQIINTQLYGDQYGPKISSIGTDYLVAWTSLGQDGSREGVFGQFLRGDGTHSGGEFRVNTTVLNQQIFPSVASDGTGRFLVAWASYTGGANSMDLMAQRYSSTGQPLSAPGTPMVVALDSYSLSVSWPPLAGFSVNHYELFADGSTTPIVVTNSMWSSKWLSPAAYQPSSMHTYQLAYVLTDGRESPQSAVASGTTWGVDGNFDGLPDDWETKYFGSDQGKWPKSASSLLAPGVTVLDVFLWGANPNDPSTWLKQWISQTPQGLFLNWNTVAGGIYQVQASADLKTWTNTGAPRFEAGTSDSIYLGFSTSGYYRVLRNRY